MRNLKVSWITFDRLVTSFRYCGTFLLLTTAVLTCSSFAAFGDEQKAKNNHHNRPETTEPSGTFEAFGPKIYTRSHGEPRPVLDSFSVQDPAAAYSLIIHNGDSGDKKNDRRVSSAVITLNGIVVAGPQSFNQKIDLIRKPVTLFLSNQLSVELKGKPGGLITLEVVGEDRVPPVIGITGPQTAATGTPISLSVEYSDVTSGIDQSSLRVKVDNRDVTTTCRSNAANADCSLGVLNPGSHTAAAEIKDRAENLATTTHTFQVTAGGGTAPLLSNLVAPDTIPFGGTATVTLDYQDADGDIVSVEASRSNALGQVSTSFAASALNIAGTSGRISLALQAEKLSFGANAFSLQLRDSQGHLSNQINFTLNVVGTSVAGTPPTVENFTVASPWNRPTGTMDRLQPPFTMTYADADGDIERVHVRITRPSGEQTITEANASKLHVIGASGLLEKRFLTLRSTDPLGTYRVEIQLIDQSGNVSNTATASLELVETGGLFPPEISGFDPQQGAAGTEVLLTGSGFDLNTPPTNRVEIGGVAAEITAMTPTSLSVIIPEGAESGQFTIRNLNGAAASEAKFIVPPSVKVSPGSTALVVGRSLQFGAAVVSSPSKSVLWSVQGIDGGNTAVGTITAEGLYTAPADIPPNQTVIISARLSADPSVRGEAQVMILPPPETRGKAFVLASVGGTVRSTDGGAAVTIPPGALAGNVEVKVTALRGPAAPPPPPGARVLGSAEFGPDGMVFNRPVTVTLPLVRYFPPGTQISLFFYDSKTGTYRDEGTRAVVTAAGNQASAAITHFTKPTLLEPTIPCQIAATAPPAINAIDILFPLQEGLNVPVRIRGTSLGNLTPKILLNGFETADILPGTFYGAGFEAGLLLNIGQLSIRNGESRPYVLRLEKGVGCNIYADYPFTVSGLDAIFVAPGQVLENPASGRYSSIEVAAGGTLRISSGTAELESTGPVTINGVIDASGTPGANGSGQICGGVPPDDSDPDEHCGRAADIADGRGGFGREVSGDPEDENFGADASQTFSMTRGFGGEPGHNIDLTEILTNVADFVTNGLACVGTLGVDAIACINAVDAAVDAGTATADALEGPNGRPGLGAVRLARSTGGGGGGGALLSIPFPPFSFKVTGGGGGSGGQRGNGIIIKTPAEMDISGEITVDGGKGGDGSNRSKFQLNELITDVTFVTITDTAPAFPGGGGGGGSGGNVRLASGTRIAFGSSPDVQARANGGLGGAGSNQSSVGADGTRRFDDPNFGNTFNPAEIDNMVTGSSALGVNIKIPGVVDPIILRVEGENGQVSETQAIFSSATGVHTGTVVLFRGFNTVCAGSPCTGMEGLEKKQVLAIFGDSDGDGLSDIDEAALGTDPLNPDTDGDGLSDADELRRRTNPLNPDTDGDGLTDGDEVSRGTDPLNPDTDGDGLSDGDEVARGTNPLNSDTDGDGISDGAEVAQGTDPLNPNNIITGTVSYDFVKIAEVNLPSVCFTCDRLDSALVAPDGAVYFLVWHIVNASGQVGAVSIMRSDGTAPPTLVANITAAGLSLASSLLAVDNSGRVFFTADDGTGVIDLYLADAGTITPITFDGNRLPGPVAFFAVSGGGIAAITDGALIALVQPGTQLSVIFNPFTSSNPADPNSPFGASALSVNDAGKVTFWSGSGNGPGIFTADGNRVERVSSLSGATAPAISNSDIVAFNNGQALVTWGPTGLRTLIDVATLLPGSGFNFTGFGPPDINDLASLAFLCSVHTPPLSAPQQCLYTGQPGSVTILNRVLHAGDSLPGPGDPFGSATVIGMTGVGSSKVVSPGAFYGLVGRPSINTSGQVAFVATLSNGKEVVVRADPK